MEITVRKNAYDIEKKTSWPDSVLEVGKDYSIQQIDFCFDSRDFSIIEKYDKNYPFAEHGTEYFLVEKKSNKFINLGDIPKDKYGVLMHSYICRGFKVYEDGIYFVTEKFENHERKCLIIGRMPLPK